MYLVRGTVVGNLRRGQSAGGVAAASAYGANRTVSNICSTVART